MMNKIGKITVGQLFVMLFVSRIVVTFTYSPLLANGDNMWNHLLSVFISFILTFLMMIPVLCLRKKYREFSVLDLSLMRFGRLGTALTMFYGLYFGFVAIYTLASYGIFLESVVDEPIPAALILTAVIISACYGAYKGIEAMARFSGIVLIGILLTFVFMMCALVPSVSPQNYEPMTYTNSMQVFRGIILMTSRMSCIPALAVLYPVLRGNVFHAAAKWNIALFLAMFVFIVMLTGSMGDYLSVQMFPVYEAATAGEFGIFRRLDAFYIGMWTAGLFCKVSLFLYLASRCFAKTFHSKNERSWIAVVAPVVLIVSLIFAKQKFDSFIFDSELWLCITLIAAVIVPLILLIGRINTKKHTRSVVASVLAVCVLCMGSMSGCSTVQLSEKLIIQGVGIDRNEDGCHLTMIVLDTEKGNEDEVTSVLQSDGKTVTEAFANAENFYGKKIMLSHNLFIVMNENAAMQIDETLKYFQSNPEARDTVSLFVEKDNAGNFISTAIEKLNYSAEGIFSLSLNGVKGEENLKCTIVDYVVAQTGIKDICIPVVSINESYAFIGGTAVFQETNFKGYLNENQTKGYLFASGKASGITSYIINTNNIPTTYHIAEQTSTVFAKVENDRVFYTLNVQVSLDNKITVTDTSTVQTAIKENIKDAVQTTLKNYKCDIFGLKQALKNTAPDFYRRQNDDINNILNDAEIFIQCIVKQQQ